jgi:hypothetical protein
MIYDFIIERTKRKGKLPELTDNFPRAMEENREAELCENCYSAEKYAVSYFCTCRIRE